MTVFPVVYLVVLPVHCLEPALLFGLCKRRLLVKRSCHGIYSAPHPLQLHSVWLVSLGLSHNYSVWNNTLSALLDTQETRTCLSIIDGETCRADQKCLYSPLLGVHISSIVASHAMSTAVAAAAHFMCVAPLGVVCSTAWCLHSSTAQGIVRLRELCWQKVGSSRRVDKRACAEGVQEVSFYTPCLCCPILWSQVQPAF